MKVTDREILRGVDTLFRPLYTMGISGIKQCCGFDPYSYKCILYPAKEGYTGNYSFHNDFLDIHYRCRACGREWSISLDMEKRGQMNVIEWILLQVELNKKPEVLAEMEEE